MVVLARGTAVIVDTIRAGNGRDGCPRQQCGARPDLCGGHRATGVPTANDIIGASSAAGLDSAPTCATSTRAATRRSSRAESRDAPYDTDDAFKECVRRGRGPDPRRCGTSRWTTTKDAGALQAPVQVHAAVEFGSLELYGGGYNSFMNT